VLFYRGMASALIAAAVACHRPVAAETFDGELGVANIDLLADKLVRDAVVVAFDLDVVVDLFEQGAPAAGKLLAATKIEAGRRSPVAGLTMSMAMPVQSTNSASPARCSWRMTVSILRLHWW